MVKIAKYWNLQGCLVCFVTPRPYNYTPLKIPDFCCEIIIKKGGHIHPPPHQN